MHRDCRDIELELCGCEEVDVIGPLAEGLHDAEGSHRFAIGYALTRLLDKVTSELLPVMTPEQRKALRSILLHDSDGELAVATLRAYEVMGDRYEREVVRMMAEGPQIKGREFRVTAAARRCLLQMDPAYSGPEQGDLLRPVENVATDELLLRPVITRSETRPEQLLRASHNATDAEDC